MVNINIHDVFSKYLYKFSISYALLLGGTEFTNTCIIIILSGILDEDQDEVNIFKRKKKLPQNGHVKAEPNHNTMMNGFQKSTKSRYTDEKRLALLSEEEEEL